MPRIQKTETLLFTEDEVKDALCEWYNILYHDKYHMKLHLDNVEGGFSISLEKSEGDINEA